MDTRYEAPHYLVSSSLYLLTGQDILPEYSPSQGKAEILSS